MGAGNADTEDRKAHGADRYNMSRDPHGGVAIHSAAENEEQSGGLPNTPLGGSSHREETSDNDFNSAHRIPYVHSREPIPRGTQTQSLSQIH